ncbi:transmembrane protein, putative (macronuclear) [Tetrahymena thermophila SB210]|uniref:Transmembrane protein, putative n=1 Tax=Tetrahymena thermophila (strain SB210) TaxID=312017 RepID=Q235D3_TETTS|nr:transmembrane protein, putative [Tetrahymena thermophila SB210]EAR92170.1 transmembrane protein, putative [Tetrahymena thermophila SB210]|eukprot:XP_001012415.1 transmembrane protein, putative [Tetrahymena thermophila SB210]
MILHTSSKLTIILLVIAYLGVFVLGDDASQTEYCCTTNGVEYQCQAGTTCCSCSECCSSSEFCIPSLGICVQYVLAVISPITLLLFILTCFWNYKTKGQYLRDLRSLKELEEQGNQILKNENTTQKSKLNENIDESTIQRKIRNSSKLSQLEENLLDNNQSNVIQISQ